MNECLKLTLIERLSNCYISRGGLINQNHDEKRIVKGYNKLAKKTSSPFFAGRNRRQNKMQTQSITLGIIRVKVLESFLLVADKHCS